MVARLQARPEVVWTIFWARERGEMLEAIFYSVDMAWKGNRHLNV